jgi:hypothetical protein
VVAQLCSGVAPGTPGESEGWMEHGGRHGPMMVDGLPLVQPLVRYFECFNMLLSMVEFTNKLEIRLDLLAST